MIFAFLELSFTKYLQYWEFLYCLEACRPGTRPASAISHNGRVFGHVGRWLAGNVAKLVEHCE